MKYTEIFYRVNGSKTPHCKVVHEKEGWENTYYEGIVHTIQSITNAQGVTAVVTRIVQHEEE